MERRPSAGVLYHFNHSRSPWTHSDHKTWMTASPGATYETFDDSLPPASITTTTTTTTTLTLPDLDPCDIQNQAEYADVTQLPWVLTVLAAAYLVIIVLSVCGNALVILTVWRNAHMHTVTNYYIVNLAVSDLLVSVLVMPLKLLEYSSPCRWNVFGNHLLCPIISYILPIFVFASVLTLVAISLERYYAIVHPLSAMKFNSKSRTKKILAATWAIPVVLASPYTFSKSYPFVITSHMGSISRQICNDRFDEIDALMYGQGVTDRFRRGYFVFLFLVIYLLPMLVILATCVRIAICLLQPIAVRRWPPATRKDTGRRHEENKRKVARMVIVVAVAFIVSWSPFYLSTLVSQIQTISGDSFLRERNFLFTMLMIHLCGFLNSCINPLIYTGMSKKFRRSFKKILGGCICCRLTHRFLRYRDSLTRGMSAAFTSSLRHSMTEVRDANDLAPSEGGSSSPHADGFHYSARSTANRGSHQSPGATNNSSVLRHHQQQQQQHRRQNHHRPYNLSQDQAQAQTPVPASTPPEMTKSKPRGFKLWRTREQGEVLIQLTPLKKKKQQKNGPTRGEKGEGACAPGTGNSLNNDLMEDDERQKFIGEEGGEVEAEENEDVEAGTKLLSKPAGSSQARDGTSDTSVVLHKHCSVGRSPGSATTGGADVLPNGVASPAVKGEDRPCETGGNLSSTLKTGECQSVKGGDGEWGMTAMNGGPRHILKDSSKAWSGGKTVDFLLKDKYNSSDLVQSQNAKNNNHGLTNQQAAVVHVGYGQTGHCVQL